MEETLSLKRWVAALFLPANLRYFPIFPMAHKTTMAKSTTT